MIDLFLYSISGKKKSQVIDDVLVDLESSDVIAAQDKKIIKHTIEVSAEGSYPSKDYYGMFYQQPVSTMSSLSEILHYVKKMKDFYNRQFISKKLISAINEGESVQDLVESASLALQSHEVVDDDMSGYAPTLFTVKEKLKGSEIKLGVPEIDEKTGGFMPGTVFSLCAYTGHGKTTTLNSMVYGMAKKGLKVLVMSIEIAPELVWPQYQCRYVFEEKGLEVSYKELIQNSLSPEKAKKIVDTNDDFMRIIGNNIMVLDEGVLTKAMIQDVRLLMALYRKVDAKLGGLDLIIWDHIGQLDLMFKDLGNVAIKTITSAGKLFNSSASGNRPVTGLAVQANREGWKRAQKRKGVYDLTAISDLNEVERSSSYVIFQ